MIANRALSRADRVVAALLAVAWAGGGAVLLATEGGGDRAGARALVGAGAMVVGVLFGHAAGTGTPLGGKRGKKHRGGVRPGGRGGGGPGGGPAG